MFNFNASLLWQLAIQLLPYLIGAIPFAVVIPMLFYGIDVRLYGSKNPGTTNVYRTVRELKGKSSAIFAALLVGVCDLLKGMLVCLIPTVNPQTNGLWAVLGHMYSPFLGFVGGKSVATYMGAVIGATWNPIFLISPVLWILATFTKIPAKVFGLTAEWIPIGPVQIKKSFFFSGFCMLLSLTLLLLSTYAWQSKVQFLAAFLVIVLQHSEHIRFTQ